MLLYIFCIEDISSHINARHLTDMPGQLISIAAILKTAREQKGLTQRALGERVGLPQSHISKIENATVDLQTTSLIEIARALDLELTILPRSLLPAVRALQHRSAPGRDRSAEPLPAYRLDEDGDGHG
jgi:HTH-type transcriptional regulator/antitoxin HipB